MQIELVFTTISNFERCDFYANHVNRVSKRDEKVEEASIASEVDVRY